eukprot:GFKZ01013873.1.p2 GENE.GFKZ01013873.1~~GFKZ01013873.1.p2  ORF type:complete len:345 (+),score=23.86 GFKZ01013873.1:27-1037(+)
MAPSPTPPRVAPPAFAALLGGLLIGLSTLHTATLTGHTTGISAFLNSSLLLHAPSLTFLSGLLLAGRFFRPPQPPKSPPLSHLILPAFLVGLGARLAGGCTSGHGVCGLSRLSPRSLVAVVVFMAAASFVATLRNLTLPRLGQSKPSRPPPRLLFALATIPPPLLALLAYACPPRWAPAPYHALLFLLGVVFGAGLVLADMTTPSTVLSFLNLRSRPWDPSLLLVFAGALPVAFLGFYPLTHRWCAPLLAPRLRVPEVVEVDPRLLVGAVLFGVGWGMAGVCPGPAVVRLGMCPRGVGAWVTVVVMAVGSLVGRVGVRAVDGVRDSWWQGPACGCG